MPLPASPALPQVPGSVRLRTEFARLTSGRFAAIQVDAGPGRREFVVATVEETERGWIPRDGRQRFPGLHAAFDAAHRLASLARQQPVAA
jgi:hypothetical protein